MVAPGVRHLAFDRADGEKFEYIPGQFVSIHFNVNEQLIRRSYSIASIPNRSDHIELALSFVEGGLASDVLFNLEPGAELNFSGPYGRLILRDGETPKRLIMIATGTGVTPYRSMLPEFEARFKQDPQLEVYVILGVRTHHDQLYTNDFLEFSKNHPNFHFEIYYSREHPQDPAAYEHSGYVQTAFSTLNLDPNNGDIIYLCGNPNMIDNAVDLLKEKEFTVQQIRREKYIS